MTHPFSGDIYVESDTAHIKSIASKLLNQWGVTTPFSDEWAHELCRYGGAEMHTVSAFMGLLEFLCFFFLFQSSCLSFKIHTK